MQAFEADVRAAFVTLQGGWQKRIMDMLSQGPTQPKGVLPCKFIAYPINPRFTGRSNILTSMGQQLSKQTDGQASFALYGMGGVGKTQIALKHIYDHINEFPAIFWITADSRAKISQGYVDAAKQLQIEPQNSQRDPDTVVQTFKAWLSNTDVDWMLIYDNADDLKLLKPFWPPTSKGSIILTSRDPASTQMVKASAHVPSMTCEEGSELFLSILHASQMEVERRSEKDNISKIGDLLGK
jgi:hypothetical protein